MAIQVNTLEETVGAPRINTIEEAEAARQEASVAQATPQATQAQKLESMNAAAAARDEERQRLEILNPWHESAARQGARGFLDVILAPGALVGAGSEALGYATGSETLKDFGRDLGVASSGKSALEAIGFVSEGGGQEGVSEAERQVKKLEESEIAWPTLTAVSRAAGMVGGALATGGAAGLAGRGTTLGVGANLSRAGAAGLVGAVEGGAGGAQSAYEEGAPLVDVLTSTVIGAGLGAGLGVGAEKLASAGSRALTRRGALDPLERATVTVDQAGGRQAQGVMSDLNKLRNEIDDAVRKAGPNPEVRQAAEAAARDAVEQKIVQKAGAFDPNKWAEATPWQKVVYRRQILDTAAQDLSQEASRLAGFRPDRAFELDGGRLKKLLKGVDGPEAIGSLQSKLDDVLNDLPATEGGAQVGMSFSGLRQQLAKSDLPGSMQIGHRVARTLDQIAESASDDLTRSWATRQAQAVRDNLSSKVWGKAGETYQALNVSPSEALLSLSDPKVLREALRTTEIRGKLPRLVNQYTSQVAKSYDAAQKLSGVAPPKGIAQDLRNLETRWSKAEDAVTLDGGPIGRVLDFAKERLSDRVVQGLGGAAGATLGGVPGMALGMMVSEAIKPSIKKVMPVLLKGSGRTVAALAGHAPKAARPATHVFSRLTRKERQDQYDERLETLSGATLRGDAGLTQEGLKNLPEMNPGLEAAVAGDMAQKVQTLLQDIPKPSRDIRGKAYETMSSDDLRRANAMWEATMQPLSVFEDFEAGNLDYDKVQYAWKQYPGLQYSCQAALLDMIQFQLQEQDRAVIPDSTLTQLDFLLGFDGTLSPTASVTFSQKVTLLGEAEAKKRPAPPPPGATAFQLPNSAPTFTQRLAGQSK